MKNKKSSLYLIIAVSAVFLFAVCFFLITHFLSQGQSTGMPLVQVKQDGSWMLIRSEYDMNVDPNIMGYDFVENQENGGYDLVLHYKNVE